MLGSVERSVVDWDGRAERDYGHKIELAIDDPSFHIPTDVDDVAGSRACAPRGLT
jgi:hypothetical protein